MLGDEAIESQFQIHSPYILLHESLLCNNFPFYDTIINIVIYTF